MRLILSVVFLISLKMVGRMWLSSEVFFPRRWFKELFVVAKLRSVLSLMMVGGMWLSSEVGNCMALRFGILLLMVFSLLS